MNALILTRYEWLSGWAELYELVPTVFSNNARFPALCCFLERCDAAFVREDWEAFASAFLQIRHLTKGGTMSNT